MTQRLLLITDEDLARIDAEVAPPAADKGSAPARPGFGAAHPAPQPGVNPGPERESQDSEPKVPDFLLRRWDDRPAASVAPPSRAPATHEARPDDPRARLRSPRRLSPYHACWMIPVAAVTAGAAMGGATWLGWVVAPALVWLAPFLFALAGRTDAASMEFLRLLAVVQAVAASAVGIEWLVGGMPDPGAAEWLALVVTPFVIEGTRSLEPASRAIRRRDFGLL